LASNKEAFMGIFSSLNWRMPYVPPSDAAGSSTLLTGVDPNVVRASGGSDSAPSRDDTQVAQQQPRTTPASNEQGVPVELPDGSPVPDRFSATGRLMAPVADLSDVAAAGRNTAQTYRRLMIDPLTRETAGQLILKDYLTNIGTGGKYDYQREGNQVLGHIFGFTQKPQFRNVSNVNVGLFAHQAGMTLEDTLKEAGEYASHFSSNARPDQPYGLDPRTAEFITLGHNIGKSGVFDRRAYP
jgi:hypothetical protein